MSLKPYAVLFLTGVVAACSPTVENVGSLDLGSVYVAPGRYDLLKCPDLAKRAMTASAREKELVSLMDRANQDPAGPVINAMIYSSELDTVHAQLAMLRKVAAEKKCDNLVTQVEQPKPATPKSPQNQQSPQNQH
jgi:hypothetical protein